MELQLLCGCAVLPKRSLGAPLNVRCLEALFPRALPNMPLASPMASAGHTCRLVGTDRAICCGCTLVFAAQRRKQPLHEKKTAFPLKGGAKGWRQFVCGHKAAHLRQKGKLYQCNFPRQTSHKSELPFLSPASSFPLAAAVSAHSFPPLPFFHYQTYSWTSPEMSHLSRKLQCLLSLPATGHFEPGAQFLVINIPFVKKKK